MPVTPERKPEFVAPPALPRRLDGVARFSIGVVILNLIVIAWGAFVRASGSGAGCGSHWPLCNGVVVPREPRIETIIELTHRTTSGLALVGVFALAAWVWRARPVGHPARPVALASAVLMVLEALLGAGLVLFGWVDKDASWGRVAALGLHLTNTFLLLAALSLTAWRLAEFPGNRWRREGVDAAVVMSMLGLTLFVGVTGAITSLGDTLFPAASLAQGVRNDFLPTAHFLERLRVVHPVLAVLTAVAVIRGAWLLTRRRPSTMTTQLARIASAMVITQLGVGALNLALNAPTTMQIVHLLNADFVWILLVLLGAAALAATPARPSA
jgi:heme A synthase